MSDKPLMTVCITFMCYRNRGM